MGEGNRGGLPAWLPETSTLAAQRLTARGEGTESVTGKQTGGSVVRTNRSPPPHNAMHNYRYGEAGPYPRPGREPAPAANGCQSRGGLVGCPWSEAVNEQIFRSETTVSTPRPATSILAASQPAARRYRTPYHTCHHSTCTPPHNKPVGAAHKGVGYGVACTYQVVYFTAGTISSFVRSQLAYD